MADTIMATSSGTNNEHDDDNQPNDNHTESENSAFEDDNITPTSIQQSIGKKG